VLGARGACDQAELAALAGVDRATLGGVVERLLARGLLRRTAGLKDRRTKLVSLTAAGRAALRRATPRVETVQQALLAPLTASQRRAFEHLCRRLLGALGSNYAQSPWASTSSAG
jgi:DNA-binding MarR family transcriptional regulator